MDSLSFNKNKYIFTSMPNISLVSNSVDDSRSKQVSLFLEELSSYNIILKDLVNYPLNEEKRNILIQRLAEKGISTNVHFKPLPMFTLYKNLGYKIEDYPNAYAQYANEMIYE